MGKLVRNETIKLFAGWPNSISVTVIGAGVIGPFASQFLGLTARSTNSDVLSIFAVICFCAGIALHLAAQAVIGELSDD